MNSTYASHLLSVQRGGGLSTYPEHIRNLPIPIACKEDMASLSKLAKKQLELYSKLKEAKLALDASLIQKSIHSVDSKIDELVFKIYNLSKEEIDALK